MGNRSSFCDLFVLEKKLPEIQRSTVRGAYVDYSQFPSSGVIGVSATSVENFNGLNGSLLDSYNPAMEIMCADFNPDSRVVAIGMKDGRTVTLGATGLVFFDSYKYDMEGVSGVSASAVCCRCSERILIGYSNGILKEFKIGEIAPCNVIVPPSDFADVPISIIEIAERDGMIFSVFNDLVKNKAAICVYKEGKLKHSLLSHTGESFLTIKPVERSKTLICLSNKRNEISLFDYTNGERIAGIEAIIPSVSDTTAISSLYILPTTQRLRQLFIGDVEVDSLDQADDTLEGVKGDILVLGLENGNVLVVLLQLTIKETKISLSILPQSLYKAQTQESLKPTIDRLAVHSLYLDPITDRLIVGNSEGKIKIFDHFILHVLNPSKAKEIEEDTKVKNSSWMYRLGLSNWNPSEGIKAEIKAKAQQLVTEEKKESDQF